jgi:multidrug efflux pump subunit AcrA (membrane-fusion protein)
MDTCPKGEGGRSGTESAGIGLSGTQVLSGVRSLPRVPDALTTGEPGNGQYWSLPAAGRRPAVAPEGQPWQQAGAPRRARGPITGSQRASSILLAVVALVGAVWYVPRVVSSDSRSFTGIVSSTGITDLNFARGGRVGRVLIHPGETVKTGQVLAAETSPAALAVLSADRAAIAADLAGVRQLRADSGARDQRARIAAAIAKLAKDRAQLGSDHVKLVEAEIVAPSAGTVMAVNGRVGETVSSDGVHNYPLLSVSSSPQAPAFSLLPEGPRPSVTGNTAGSALPMIVLRGTVGWLVNILVSQDTVGTIRSGERAVISVPAVNLNDVHGHVAGISPTPVRTSAGVAYQVAVNVAGRNRVIPFSGMTANVQLDP